MKDGGAPLSLTQRASRPAVEVSNGWNCLGNFRPARVGGGVCVCFCFGVRVFVTTYVLSL